MKIQRSLLQTVRLGCMLIFLTGFAAYGSAVARQVAGASAPTQTASISPTPSRTSTSTQTASVTPTPTRTPTATQTAYTHIPPGRAKKTGIPAYTHIPPGRAKKTSTPTRTHLPPGLVKKTPTPTITPIPPWTGSVLIQGGAWGIAGCPGETIYIRVDLTASSPFGPVDEMRARSGVCSTDQCMEDASWEPFAPSKFFPHTFGYNWYWWFASAQFRDVYGNLSPVYSDKISMEGGGFACQPPPPARP